MVYTIRLSKNDAETIDEMTLFEGITKAELIRRAINFYNVKIKAIIEKKKLFFEDKNGVKEWIVI